MLIQSKQKRANGTVVDIGGQKYHFKENKEGHEVCDIEDAAVIHRLTVEIPEGFKLYNDNDVAPAVPKTAAAAQTTEHLDRKPANAPVTMIITDGETEVDLMTQDKDQLKEIASGMGIKVHHKWPEQTIRDKIIEKTRAPE